MLDGAAPEMRFSATEEDEGCRNFTVSPAAILKLRQSMIARPVDCVISVTEPLCVIVAAPPLTVPPEGAAKTFCVSSAIAQLVTSRKRRYREFTSCPSQKKPHNVKFRH